MSCAGKGYGRNPQSSDYLTSQFFSSIVANTISNSIRKSARNCRKMSKTSYPSFTPNLYNLTETTSVAGVYSLVYVNGSNFLPGTYIEFGNLGILEATYYSSFNLSFVVPLYAIPGNYDVRVVNVYNDNFSPSINQSYPGIQNYSEPITYVIT